MQATCEAGYVRVALAEALGSTASIEFGGWHGESFALEVHGDFHGLGESLARLSSKV